MTHIHEACERAGFYVVSEGSTAPKVVLGRLLEALRVLTPHAELVEVVVDLAVPSAALEDEAHAWWSTDDATEFLSSLFACLTESAPPGFILTSDGSWERLGFFRLEELPEFAASVYERSTAPAESLPRRLPRWAAPVWRLALPADLTADRVGGD